MKKKINWILKERSFEVVAFSFALALFVFGFLKDSPKDPKSGDAAALVAFIAGIGFTVIGGAGRTAFHFFSEAGKSNLAEEDDPTISSFQA